MSTTGPAQALGLMQAMGASGIASFRVENLAIAAQANKVLTERVDYMINSADETTRALRVMGVFEIGANGKIVRWSDYFDTAGLKSGSAA
jgi:limonene-1,2-epoxide hydrolase